MPTFNFEPNNPFHIPILDKIPIPLPVLPNPFEIEFEFSNVENSDDPNVFSVFDFMPLLSKYYKKHATKLPRIVQDVSEINPIHPHSTTFQKCKFNLWIDSMTQNSIIQNNIAITKAKDQLEQLESAISSIDKKFDPDSPDAANNTTTPQNNTKDPKLIISSCLVHFALGLIHQRLQKYRSSIEQFSQSLQLLPQLPIPSNHPNNISLLTPLPHLPEHFVDSSEIIAPIFDSLISLWVTSDLSRIRSLILFHSFLSQWSLGYIDSQFISHQIGQFDTNNQTQLSQESSQINYNHYSIPKSAKSLTNPENNAPITLESYDEAVPSLQPILFSNLFHFKSLEASWTSAATCSSLHLMNAPPTSSGARTSSHHVTFSEDRFASGFSLATLTNNLLTFQDVLHNALPTQKVGSEIGDSLLGRVLTYIRLVENEIRTSLSKNNNSSFPQLLDVAISKILQISNLFIDHPNVQLGLSSLLLTLTHHGCLQIPTIFCSSILPLNITIQDIIVFTAIILQFISISSFDYMTQENTDKLNDLTNSDSENTYPAPESKSKSKSGSEFDMSKLSKSDSVKFLTLSCNISLQQKKLRGKWLSLAKHMLEIILVLVHIPNKLLHARSLSISQSNINDNDLDIKAGHEFDSFNDTILLSRNPQSTNSSHPTKSDTFQPKFQEKGNKDPYHLVKSWADSKIHSLLDNSWTIFECHPLSIDPPCFVQHDDQIFISLGFNSYIPIPEWLIMPLWQPLFLSIGISSMIYSTSNLSKNSSLFVDTAHISLLITKSIKPVHSITTDVLSLSDPVHPASVSDVLDNSDESIWHDLSCYLLTFIDPITYKPLLMDASSRIPFISQIYPQLGNLASTLATSPPTWNSLIHLKNPISTSESSDYQDYQSLQLEISKSIQEEALVHFISLLSEPPHSISKYLYNFNILEELFSIADFLDTPSRSLLWNHLGILICSSVPTLPHSTYQSEYSQFSGDKLSHKLVYVAQMCFETALYFSILSNSRSCIQSSIFNIVHLHSLSRNLCESLEISQSALKQTIKSWKSLNSLLISKF